MKILIIVMTIEFLFLGYEYYFLRKLYLAQIRTELKLTGAKKHGIQNKNRKLPISGSIYQTLEGLNAEEISIEEQNARIIMEEKMKYAQLQNQINPHFLYNTLENIRGQAIIDENSIIADMTEALARFFRYNISKDNDIVKLSQELENIKTYVQIQQYRFRDRFEFSIQNHGDVDAPFYCMIPKMTLQPIVENAIFHGMEKKLGKGHICVHIEMTEERIFVLITDDGIGMPKETLQMLQNKLKTGNSQQGWVEEKEGDGIAMVNINNRFRLLYGNDYGLTISSIEGVGTEVELILPLISGGGRETI